MSRKLLLPLGIVVIVLGIIGFSSLFTVHQTQQALVLQFGEPKRVVSEAGIHFKLPFIQNVVYYERRVLNLDPPVERVILADQKPLLVDSFARYTITDPLRFYQAVRTEDELRNRLGSIVNAAVRNVLGNVNLPSVLSAERSGIMGQIREEVDEASTRYGIQLVDLRIRRTDLPEEINQAVYARMKSEREREAAEFRAQGFEQAQRIKATADREAVVIRAEANRESQIFRGEGDAARTRTLNEAYGRDPQFFDFYRSMNAYENSLNPESTYMVLSPQSEFFRFFDAAFPQAGEDERAQDARAEGE